MTILGLTIRMSIQCCAAPNRVQLWERDWVEVIKFKIDDYVNISSLHGGILDELKQAWLPVPPSKYLSRARRFVIACLAC